MPILHQIFVQEYKYLKNSSNFRPHILELKSINLSLKSSTSQIKHKRHSIYKSVSRNFLRNKAADNNQEIILSPYKILKSNCLLKIIF